MSRAWLPSGWYRGGLSVDRDRFDQFAIVIAEGQSPRTARRKLFGGSFAALLAAVGLAAGDDDTAAKSCAKKCKKKNSKKARRKCRKKCQPAPNMLQEGSGELESQSGTNCVEMGSCTDAATGTLTGTPIAEGTFEGELTGTNFEFTEESFTADFAGTITATETETGDTLTVAVELTLTQILETGVFTFEGTFEITGGTGRFAGATGDGTVTGGGTRSEDGQTGTIDEFTLEGNIDLA
jgi:hypothetical protein